MADLQPRVDLGNGVRAAVDQPEPALELLGRMPQLSGHQWLGVLLTQPVEYGDRVGDPGVRNPRVLVGAAELLGNAREHGPDLPQVGHVCHSRFATPSDAWIAAWTWCCTSLMLLTACARSPFASETSDWLLPSVTRASAPCACSREECACCNAPRLSEALSLASAMPALTSSILAISANSPSCP